jgi:uncharacterized protein DUF5916
MRILCVLGVLLFAGGAEAQPAFRIARTARPPRLADYLSGTPPHGQTPIGGFVQREPADGKPSSERTEAYLSYDDDHLYVVFVCHDSEPAKLRARMTRREDFFGDEVVGVILDTFHDRRRSYLFLTNPYGIQMDGITAEGRDDDYSFDTLWHSEGQLTPFGYVVRIAIPFKSLRFSGLERQTWGFALGRIIPRADETAFWPYITNKVAGFGQQLAALEGLEGISAGRNIQLIPYGAFAGARFLDAAGTGYETDADARTGLDAKVVVKDAFTIDAAINPDFSQVESDEPQVTTNQRFEVFFPERRPFFIENATYFDTPINLFFSRRVADPQFGGRITGKTRGWALGALAMDDRAPGRGLPDADPHSGDRAGIGIVRAQRDVGEQSSVGVFLTSRGFGSASNRVASIDGSVKLTKNTFASAQAVVSRTDAGAEAARAGGAFLAMIRRSSRTWGYATRYQDISPDFRATLGFVPRVDMREVHQSGYRSWWPNRRIVRVGVDGVVSGLWSHNQSDAGRDSQSRLQDWAAAPGFNVQFKGQTSVDTGHREAMERFEGREFRKRRTNIGVGTEFLKWLGVSAGARFGTDINFFPPEGVAPFLADARDASVRVTLRPAARLRMEQRYLFNALSRGGRSIFTNHIFRTRANYQFTRAFSMRAILDYSALSAEASLVALSRDRRCTGDVLFTYLLHPGTALYVGYTDRYLNDDEQPSPRLRSSARQVFVKASYLLRF